MYTLDFETMLQVMQEHQKTGLLYAELPAGTVGLQEACRIEIKLRVGTIVTCTIASKSGWRLPDKKMIKKISQLGPLLWTFVPETTAVLPAAQSAPAPIQQGEITFFPRRTVQIEQVQMRSWPRLHRGIFVLADGTRSIVKLAEILSVPPFQVERALYDLQSIGVIAMGP
ncbi:hypothetical protein EPA93_46155 [Ktedonosporobacter rubrisoli]|uniref:Uncharacterized protein n=1 Tax=Ktedonosporobacter rubrisoli TaxID=2509675 RepID=A0A4P6K3W0_KTERU|nr:hypothetical protein [Ktedonosporobacter rubrisoli]QBD82958.1 hypothetical protein EPA93_46155 [Ktedonosporobacter rubrisoli]